MKTKIEIQTLRNRAFPFMLEQLVEHLPQYPPFFVKSILETYADKKGANAVADLYGFYMYCRDIEHDDGFIWSNIMHDINGRDDDLCCPRTSGYAAEFYDIVKPWS